VRPGAQYTHVAVLDRGGGDDAIAYTPSATTWRWIAERIRPVLIDVRVGVVEVLDDGVVSRVEEPEDPSSMWETQRSWLGRDATHVLALPLVAVGGASCGMVTVEIHAPAGVATRVLPLELVDSFGAVVAAVTPHLTSLPS